MLGNDYEFFRDPYPTYMKLRDIGGGVHRHDAMNCWLISRYEDVLGCLADGRLSSGGERVRKGVAILPPALQAEGRRFVEILDMMMLFKDSTEHTRMRRATRGTFGKAQQLAMAARVRKRAGEIGAKLREATTIDLAATYAYELPVQVIGELMGIPVIDRRRVVTWSDDLADFFVSARPTVEEFRRASDSTLAAFDYFRQLYLRDDACKFFEGMFGNLVDKEAKLQSDELASQAILFLFGAQETTRSAITLAAHRLMLDANTRRAVGQRTRPMSEIAQEILRLDSPVQFVGRSVKEDLEVGGMHLRKGETVLLLIGSANRDERVFEVPNEFRPGRRGRPLTFGRDSHQCIGEFLAMVEIEAALEDLSGWVGGFAIEHGGVLWKQRHGIRGMAALPISRATKCEQA